MKGEGQPQMPPLGGRTSTASRPGYRARAGHPQSAAKPRQLVFSGPGDPAFWSSPGGEGSWKSRQPHPQLSLQPRFPQHPEAPALGRPWGHCLTGTLPLVAACFPGAACPAVGAWAALCRGSTWARRKGGAVWVSCLDPRARDLRAE